MNKLEEIIYHALYKNPQIKLFVRNMYQGLFDLLPKPKEFTPEGTQFISGCYMGFHDTSQLSEDDRKLLVLRNPFDGRMPMVGECEEIGYYDIDSKGIIGEFHCIDKTFAWNFHKGCREQWFDNESVVFNTFENGKIVAKLANVYTHEHKLLNYPIDTFSHDRKQYLSFSYERLEFCMSGYGYPYKDESYLEKEAPKETGLFIVDVKSGERKLLVSLNELAETAPAEFKQGYMHYVTHSEFSHDDRYISFLHRWIRKEGTNLKRWTRIMVYDRELCVLIELPSQISGSHYVWNTKHQLLATCIINKKCVQVLFDMNDVKKYQIIAGDILNSDGHQTFINDNEFITDTYPDKRRMSFLYKVNIRENTAVKIGAYYSPKKFQSDNIKGHVACDLHPRASFSKKYITFDCPSTGVRSVFMFKI